MKIMPDMKPILFNTEAVRALLGGCMSMTRRVMEPQPRMVYFDGKLQDSGEDLHDGEPLEVLISENQNGAVEQVVAPYRPGDILYVRETWEENGYYEEFPWETSQYIYKADFKLQPPIPEWFRGWRPSIHMPRDAARIFLRVTDVRAERLQDISIEDIKREGIWTSGTLFPREDFSEQYNRSLSKKKRVMYSWDKNPFVWVVTFERCKKTKM